MRLCFTGLVCSLLLLSGCADNVTHGEEAPSCSTPLTPCGGDLTGTWKIDSACGENAAAGACTGSPGGMTALPAGSAFSGAFTFNADHTMSEEVAYDALTETETLPASCVSGVSSCAEIGSTTTVEGLTQVVTCTGTPSEGCACTTVVNGNRTVAGTYSTGGNIASVTIEGAALQMSYCVSGPQLQLSYDTPSPPQDGGASTTTSVHIVLTRQ